MRMVENKAGIGFQILSASVVAMAVCWDFTLFNITCPSLPHLFGEICCLCIQSE